MLAKLKVLGDLDTVCNTVWYFTINYEAILGCFFGKGHIYYVSTKDMEK